MKVVFFTYECPGLSGNFRRSIQLSEGIQKNGSEVLLITSASKLRLFPKFFRYQTVTVMESIGIMPYKFRFSGFDPFDVLFRTIYGIIIKADVYVSCNPKPVTVIPSFIAARLLRKIWVFDWADLWGYGGIREIKKQFTSLFTQLSMRVETLFEKFATVKADLTTCVSSTMAKDSASRGGNSLYVPVGTSTDIQGLPKRAARKKINLSSNIKVVGFVYTDSPDAEFIKDIITPLASKQIFFIVIGPPLFTNKKPINVLFNDFVDRNHLGVYLSTCDFCFVPLTDRPINRFRYPNKISDYLACGKPFLANAVSDMPTLITKHQIGWLAQPNRADTIRQIEAIAQNPVEIRKKTSAAKKYAAQHDCQFITRSLYQSLTALTSVTP